MPQWPVTGCHDPRLNVRYVYLWIHVGVHDVSSETRETWLLRIRCKQESDSVAEIKCFYCLGKWTFPFKMQLHACENQHWIYNSKGRESSCLDQIARRLKSVSTSVAELWIQERMKPLDIVGLKSHLWARMEWAGRQLPVAREFSGQECFNRQGTFPQKW